MGSWRKFSILSMRHGRGFARTNRRGGVSGRKVERELVKDNQGGPDMGAVEGPRSADDAPASSILNLFRHIFYRHTQALIAKKSSTLQSKPQPQIF